MNRMLDAVAPPRSPGVRNVDNSVRGIAAIFLSIVISVMDGRAGR